MTKTKKEKKEAQPAEQAPAPDVAAAVQNVKRHRRRLLRELAEEKKD